MKKILDHVSETLDSSPGLRIGEARLEHEIALEELRIKHARELLAMLPSVGDEPPPVPAAAEEEEEEQAGAEGSAKSAMHVDG